MRAGMELLLALIRGDVLARSPEEAEWQAFFALAEEQQVAPFVVAQIRRAGISLTSAIESKAAAVEREAALSTFFWCAELRGLLRAFGRACIRVLPLKGPFLAQRIYGREGLRTSRDLDLLVQAADVPAAEALLLSLGFQPTDAGDDYHRPWLRGTTGVELHFNVENPLAFDFGIADAWERAEETEFGGERCWKFSPQDEILFLALHGMRHRFDRLSLVLDIALTMEQHVLSTATDLLPESRSSRIQSVLELSSELAKRVLPASAGIELSPRRHTSQLAERVWKRLQTELTEELDWQARHRFYLELDVSLQARLRTRFRHARILVSRLIEADFAFAARFGCRRRWQVWLLRPARLLTARLTALGNRQHPFS